MEFESLKIIKVTPRDHLNNPMSVKGTEACLVTFSSNPWVPKLYESYIITLVNFRKQKSFQENRRRDIDLKLILLSLKSKLDENSVKINFID